MPDVAGAYVLSLVVSDGKLSSAPARVTITAQGASSLGISPNAVSARAYRARRTLRRRILARALRPLSGPLVCIEIRHRLDAYVVGGLPTAVSKAIDQHLDTCAACERSVLGSASIEHGEPLAAATPAEGAYRLERGPAGEVA